jgi:hypothetical protein
MTTELLTTHREHLLHEQLCTMVALSAAVLAYYSFYSSAGRANGHC